MIRVKGHQNLYRDENSGAIINCDSSAYNQYVNVLENKELHKTELNKMKQDIDEIKSLLKQLINESK
jgi:hypothetical protein